MSTSDRDPIDAMRFLDGEMHDVERTRFAQRMAQDPELQELVAGLEADRSWFAPDRLRDEAVPPGLAARVVAQLQAEPAPPREGPTPSAVEGSSGVSLAGTLRWCQRLLLAALVLLGLAVALYVGRLAGGDAQRLEAAPDEIRLEMERLDQRIREQELGQPR